MMGSIRVHAINTIFSGGIFFALCAGFMKGPDPVQRSNTPMQENHAPVIKILNPKANSEFGGGDQIRYQISVSDKEDGDSKFQEINEKEVFLEVRYLPVPAKSGGAAANSTVSVGLEIIKGSNCLNCHAFRGKLIGPSFYDISKRYPYTKANTDTLVRRIREGASGVWGKVAMPTHPELSKEQGIAIVKWICQHAAEPDVSYYSGTEGSFRLAVPEDGVAAKPGGAGRAAGVAGATGTAGTARTAGTAGTERTGGVARAGGGARAGREFLLIASYTDHGAKDKSSTRLRAQDSVRIGLK